MTDIPDTQNSSAHPDASARMLSDMQPKRQESYLSAALGVVADPVFGQNSSASNGVKFWGSEFLKTASLFMPGKVGYIASMALGAADQAKVGDSLLHNVVDGGLGAAKGGLTKGAFSVIGGNQTFGTGLWTIPAKGMLLGSSGRFLDTTLTRENWQDAQGKFDLSKGTATTFDSTFNGKALMMDAALFGVAEGSALGLNKISGGLLDRSPLARNMFMGSVFGGSSGALSELEAQRSAGKPLDFAAIAEHSLMNAAVDGLAAGPGGLHADPAMRRTIAEKFDTTARTATAVAAFGTAALTGSGTGRGATNTHETMHNEMNSILSVTQPLTASELDQRSVHLDQVRLGNDTTITIANAPTERGAPADVATRTGSSSAPESAARTPAEASAEATAATLRDLGVSVDSLRVRQSDTFTTRTGSAEPTVAMDGVRVVETYENANLGTVRIDNGDRFRFVDSKATVTGNGTLEVFGDSQISVNVPEGQTMRIILKEGNANLTVAQESKGTIEFVNQTNNPEPTEKLRLNSNGQERPEVRVLDSLTDVLTPEEIQNVKQFRADEAELRKRYVPLSSEAKQQMAIEEYGDGAAIKGKVFHIVIGPPGSGKTTYFGDTLVKRFGAMMLDSDTVKPKLPGYEHGLGTNVVHPDSADIINMKMEMGFANGDNMISFELGRFPDMLEKKIKLAESHGYQVAVHLADLPPEEATRRTYERGQRPPNADGVRQMVDPNYALTVAGRNPMRAFEHVINVPEVVEWTHIDTNVPWGDRPILVRRSSSKIDRPLAGPELDELFRLLPPPG